MKCIIDDNPKGFNKLSNKTDISRISLASAVNIYQDANDTSEMPSLNNLGISMDEKRKLITKVFNGQQRPTVKQNTEVSIKDSANNVIDNFISTDIYALTEKSIKDSLISNEIVDENMRVDINPQVAISKIISLNSAFNSSMKVPQDLLMVNQNGESAEVVINKHALNGLKSDFKRSKLHSRYAYITDVETALKALKSDSTLSAREKSLVSELQDLNKNTESAKIDFVPNASFNGQYNPSSNEILLNEQTYDAGTILHEIAHTLGVSALAKGSANAINFERMFNELKARTGDAKIDNLDGIDDYQEFFANLFNNTALVTELESTPSDTLYAAGSTRTVFRAIMDFIRKILRLSPTQTNAYASAVKLGMASIEYDMQYNTSPRHNIASKYYDMNRFSELMHDATQREMSNHAISKDLTVHDTVDHIKSKLGKDVEVINHPDGRTEITALKDQHDLQQIFINIKKLYSNQAQFVNSSNGKSVSIMMYPASPTIGRGRDNTFTLGSLMDKIGENTGKNFEEKAKTVSSGELVKFTESKYDNLKMAKDVLIASGANPAIEFLSEKEMNESFSIPSINADDSSVFSNENTIPNAHYDAKKNVVYVSRNKADSKTLAAVSINVAMQANKKKANKFLGYFIDNWGELNAIGIDSAPKLIDRLAYDTEAIMALKHKDSDTGADIFAPMIISITKLLNSDGKILITKEVVNELLDITPDKASIASLYAEDAEFDLSDIEKKVLNTKQLRANIEQALHDRQIDLTETATDGMSDLEYVFAMNTISRNRQPNITSLKLIAGILEGMPISDRINGNIENQLFSKFGLTEDKIEQPKLLETAYKQVQKKLALTNRVKFLEDSGLSKISESLLNSKAQSEIEAEGLDSGYGNKSIDADLDILERTLASRAAFYKNLGSVGVKKHKDAETKVKEFKRARKDKQYAKAVSKFVSDSISESKAKLNHLINIEDKYNDGKMSGKQLNDANRSIKETMSYVDTYSAMVDSTKALIRRSKGLFEDPAATLVILNEIADNISAINEKINGVAKDTTAARLQIFADASGYKDSQGSLRSLLNESEDIGWHRKSLYAMMDSSHPVLGVTDYATKMYLENARQSLVTFRVDYQKAHQALMDSGVKSTEFMYEKDKEGNPTGYFISEHYEGAWHKAIEAKKIELEATPNATVESVEKGMTNFTENPATSKSENYKNLDFDKQLNTKAKKDYYKYTLKQSAHINSTMSSKRNKLIAPMINRSSTDLLMDIAKGKKGGIGEFIRGQFANKVDDVLLNPDALANGEEVEATTNTLQTQSGAQLKSIPIHYIHRLDDLKNLSMDTTQAMTALAGSVFNSHELSKIIDTIELANTLLGTETKVRKRDSLGRKITAKFRVDGKDYSQDVYEEGESNIKGRMQSYLDMVYYGQVRNTGRDFKMNVFGEEIIINSEKILDKIGTYTAFNNLALNLYAGIQNPMNAEAQMLIEANAGQNFGHKDLAWATKKLMTQVPGALRESAVDKRLKENKLNLWFEKANTFNSSREDTGYTGTDMNNGFARILKPDLLFLTSSAGEYMVQGKLSLALANRVKVWKGGKEMNIYDAMEIKDNQLIIPKGVSLDKDGKTKFTDEMFKSFVLKQNAINVALNGNYNEIDKTEIQRSAAGRLAIMFRKFMVPGFNRRWSKEYYNFALGREYQGYHYHTFNIIRDSISDSKVNLLNVWGTLTNEEKMDIHRSLTEFALYFGVSAALMMLGNLEGDDDENWIKYMAVYQMYRFKSEIGFFISPGELPTLIKSPAASIDVLDQITKTFGMMLDVPSWGDEYSSGQFKDQNKFGVQVKKLLPMWKTTQSWSEPKQKIQFFN